MRNSICNDCAKRTRCDMEKIGRSPLAISTCYGYEKGNPTNADRIRAMTDEELAEWLDGSFRRADWCDISKFPNDDCMEVPCLGCIIDWLKQEASE